MSKRAVHNVSIRLPIKATQHTRPFYGHFAVFPEAPCSHVRWGMALKWNVFVTCKQAEDAFCLKAKAGKQEWRMDIIFNKQSRTIIWLWPLTVMAIYKTLNKDWRKEVASFEDCISLWHEQVFLQAIYFMVNVIWPCHLEIFGQSIITILMCIAYGGYVTIATRPDRLCAKMQCDTQRFNLREGWNLVYNK